MSVSYLYKATKVDIDVREECGCEMGDESEES